MRSDFSGTFLMLWPTSSVWIEAQFPRRFRRCPPQGAVPRLPLRANILMLTGFTFKQKVFEGLWTQSGGPSCDKGLPDCPSSGSSLVSPQSFSHSGGSSRQTRDLSLLRSPRLRGRDVWLGYSQISLPLDRHSAWFDAPRVSGWLCIIHFSLVTAGKSD